MRLASSDSGKSKCASRRVTPSASDEDEADPRSSLFNVTTSAGNKRQRIATPLAIRVAELEDEPKVPSLSRSESLATLLQNQENKEN